MSVGPHHTSIGYLELSMISTADFKLCGQLLKGPWGVADQSFSYVSRFISPPAGKILPGCPVASGVRWSSMKSLSPSIMRSRLEG
jgi:hypothetical protein